MDQNAAQPASSSADTTNVLSQDFSQVSNQAQPYIFPSTFTTHQEALELALATQVVDPSQLQYQHTTNAQQPLQSDLYDFLPIDESTQDAPRRVYHGGPYPDQFTALASSSFTGLPQNVQNTIQPWHPNSHAFSTPEVPSMRDLWHPEPPAAPGRSTVGTFPREVVYAPTAPTSTAENQDVPANTASEDRKHRKLPKLASKKETDRSSGEPKKRKRPEDDMEAMQRDAEGILGWGWKQRADHEPGPTFGDTTVLVPLYTENIVQVRPELHASFEVSRNHASKVSDDGGPMVHELQKRNIFQIKDMSFNLYGPPSRAQQLMISVNNHPLQVKRMFIRLVGLKNYGEIDATTETPLETRGKARQYKPAKIVEIFEEIAYQKIENGFSIHDGVIYGDSGELPDTYSECHMEFKHATSGNKTTGYWRLDSQAYYRLALQLYVYTGDDAVQSSYRELQDSRQLVKVAESRTDLLIVRGRPPGGRETDEKKKSAAKKSKQKQSGKNQTATRTKRQKREETPDDEEDELLFQPNSSNQPRPSNSAPATFENARTHQSPYDTGHAAKIYGTRKASKRAYEEEHSDSNEHDAPSDAQDSEYEDYNQRLNESVRDSSTKLPQGQPHPCCTAEHFTGGRDKRVEQSVDDGTYAGHPHSYLPTHIDDSMLKQGEGSQWQGYNAPYQTGGNGESATQPVPDLTWDDNSLPLDFSIFDNPDFDNADFDWTAFIPQPGNMGGNLQVDAAQPSPVPSRCQRSLVPQAQLRTQVPPPPESAEPTVQSDSDGTHQSSPVFADSPQDTRLTQQGRNGQDPCLTQEIYNAYKSGVDFLDEDGNLEDEA